MMKQDPNEPVKKVGTYTYYDGSVQSFEYCDREEYDKIKKRHQRLNKKQKIESLKERSLNTTDKAALDDLLQQQHDHRVRNQANEKKKRTFKSCLKIMKKIEENDQENVAPKNSNSAAIRQKRHRAKRRQKIIDLRNELDDKCDELDLLHGVRKVMRKGDKYGCRTVGHMNYIIDKGHEIRMNDLRKIGLDIRPKDAVVPQPEIKVSEVDLSDDELDFRELYIKTKQAYDQQKNLNVKMKEQHEKEIQVLQSQIKYQEEIMKNQEDYHKIKLDLELSTSLTKQYKNWVEQMGIDLKCKDALISEYSKKIENLKEKLNQKSKVVQVQDLYSARNTVPQVMKREPINTAKVSENRVTEYKLENPKFKQVEESDTDNWNMTNQDIALMREIQGR